MLAQGATALRRPAVLVGPRVMEGSQTTGGQRYRRCRRPVHPFAVSFHSSLVWVFTVTLSFFLLSSVYLEIL